jgi:hypothetical protein
MEESRLRFFGQALLDAYTTAHNSASHEAFTDNTGYLPADAAHFAMFSGIAAEEIKWLNLSLDERFPKPSQKLLKKCLAASIAALICRDLVQSAAE